MTVNCSASQQVLANSLRVVFAKREVRLYSTRLLTMVTMEPCVQSPSKIVCNAVKGHCLRAMHQHTNGRFDWLIAEQFFLTV